MRKIAFLLIFSNLFLSCISLQAQIINGSFTQGANGFYDWTLVGVPAVVDTIPTPPSGLTAAQIQSTDLDTNNADSATIAALDMALGTTLPPTSGSNPTQPYGSFLPKNGEAIYQTFMLKDAGTLNFEYSYQTNDYFPFDSVGFVLDGVYTQLVTTPDYTGSTITALTPYSDYSVELSPGIHTLAFVAYNTNDEYGSTSLFVTDITVPEPKTWLLLTVCLAVLALVTRLKSFRSRPISR